MNAAGWPAAFFVGLGASWGRSGARRGGHRFVDWSRRLTLLNLDLKERMMARQTLIAAMVLAAAAPIALGQADEKAKPNSVPAQKIAAPAGQPAAKAPKVEPTLHVGDKAPAITIEKWVKGEPITGYEKGRVYVVEFWATWCGPCIASMPHLTQLQKEYKGQIQIIGVTTKDPNNSLEQVEKMVAEKGDEGMGYAVACDEGTKTKEALFKAAGQTGIPCSFVIDGTGTVAYIGHPMWLDIPLERITKGTWDPKKGMEEVDAAKERYSEVSKAMSKDPKEALNLLAAFEKDYPGAAAMFASSKYGLLVKAGDPRAAAMGKEMYESAVKAKDLAKLGTIARANIDPKAEATRDLDLALKAATKAVELSDGKTAGPLLTLARVHFVRGEKDKAIETQKKAIELTKEGPARTAYEKTLAEYEGK